MMEPNKTLEKYLALRAKTLKVNVRQKRKEYAMNHIKVLTLALLVATVVGCTSTNKTTSNASLEVPVRLDLGVPIWSKSSGVRLRSGQMVDPNVCCPPLELRDTSGAVVQEFSLGGPPVRLTAGAGTYLLVGHDPGAEECVLRIEVID
jgi:hypothetical protein